MDNEDEEGEEIAQEKGYTYNGEDLGCVNYDYTKSFTTDEIFHSRHTLIHWTQQVGKQNGLVVVIKNSEVGGAGRKPRITFACERSGAYRKTVTEHYASSKMPLTTRKRKTINSGTRKCGCPFKLQGMKLAYDDDWTLMVICGVHNHPRAVYLEGHSYVGRLTEEEMKLVVDMSINLVKPRQIWNTIKHRDPGNCSTLKTIYNARHRNRVVEKAGRSEMQQLLKHLNEHGYIEYHTVREDTDNVRDIFWAHRTSIELLRTFSEVLIMDCTYKTNRYRLPLLEIVGVTSTEMTFSAAFVYMEFEREGNFIWALHVLRSLLEGCSMPHVILTDRDLASMNAIELVFPESKRMLCRWHIQKCVELSCKKNFSTVEMAASFMTLWQAIVYSSSVHEYNTNLCTLLNTFSRDKDVTEYVQKTWLDHYKEDFVSAWVDDYMHFGNYTTNRVESAHSKLKRHLGSSNCGFDTSWSTIHSLLELQHCAIKASFEKSKHIAQHNFRPEVFRELRGFISKSALTIVHNESLNADCTGKDESACACVVRHTHGLPCAHMIAKYRLEERPIPLFCIHPRWRKLDMCATKVDVPLEVKCRQQLELLYTKFIAQDATGRIQLLRKLMELNKPASSYVLEPEVKMTTRGRPSAKDKKQMNSTRRDPSAFEFEPSFKDSNDMPIEVTPISSKKPRAKKGRKKDDKVYENCDTKSYYLLQFPEGLRDYILYVKDVLADGNCGFRAIAGLLGFGEDGWAEIRKGLIFELRAHYDGYVPLYGGPDRVADLMYSLSFFENGPAYDRWMTMPDMGYLIASHYSVVLLSISAMQCLTFLPLWSVPPPKAARRIIAIGFVNENHFVQLHMKPGCPMAPPVRSWARYHHRCADGWDSYDEENKLFKKITPSSVATRDTIDLDDY